MELEIEGKRLSVSSWPEQLGKENPVFNKLFKHSTEQTQNHMVLENEKYEEFAMFLKCLNPMLLNFEKKSLFESHYKVLCKLAKKYVVESLEKEIYEFLEKEMIPKLNPKNEDDRKEGMEILSVAHSMKYQSLYLVAQKKALLFHVKFIQSYQKKIDAEIIMELLSKKWDMAASYLRK